MIAKLSKKLLTPFVLVAIVCAMSPGAASATEFEHGLCDDPSVSTADLGFFYEGTGPFQLNAECPDLRLEMWRSADDGERRVGALWMPPNLRRFAATMSGGPSVGSGVTVSMRLCNFSGCGRALTPGAAGAPSSGVLTLADGIPADATTLVIEAECTTAGGCARQPDTVISDLMFTYSLPDDMEPPVVSLANGWGVPYLSTEPTPIEPGDYVYVDMDDGVRMWWTIDDGPSIDTSCADLPDDEVNYNCGFFGMIRPPLFEGVIKFTVYVEDENGNVGSASALLTNDSTAPGPPQNLQVEDGTGWINEYEFSASWNNPSADTDVVEAKFEIRDQSGLLVRSGAAPGEDVEALQSLVSTSGKFTLSVWLVDAAGNKGASSSVDFARDWIPPTAPSIEAIPIVNASFVGSGLSIGWGETIYWNPTFSGICSYRIAINTLQQFEPIMGAGATTIPYADEASFEISASDLAQMSDGIHYFHVAGTSCAGVNGPPSAAPLVIDRQAPSVVSEPASGGWIAPGTPLVLRADDDSSGNAYAGVSAISYSIDGGSVQTVPGPKATITLPQGMHAVTYSAEDIAGNKSVEATIHAGVDPQAPSAAFGGIDPADPALVTVSVSDADSGVGDAWIEYRPPGSPTWARLISTSEGDSPRALVARFPDDDSLPSGEYQLRIVARDRAGNSVMTSSRVDGTPASLTLPLRRRAAITLAVAPNKKSKTRNSLTVRFGKTVVARGTLRDPDGNPLVGSQVALMESVSGGQRKQIATAMTDDRGAFMVLVPSGPSRLLVANFRGDSLRGSSVASATFNVRGRVTLRKLRKSVKSGKRFYLRGKVDPGPVSLPNRGAQVVIQHRSGRRWSGLVVRGRTSSDGSFEIPWSQKTRGRAVRMKFRAAVEPEAGWPYATGYSVTRKTVVR